MTLATITANFARLRTEIDALGSGQHSEARVARLICELDQIDRDLLAFKRLARTAPTLRDAVQWADFPTPSRFLDAIDHVAPATGFVSVGPAAQRPSAH